METKIKVVYRHQTFSSKLYLPAILQGLSVTVGHFMRNVIFRKDVVTLQYPEETKAPVARARGRHRLLMRDDGFIRCVACYMCETVCPAKCIHIEAGEMADKSVEKYPVVFDIDELRCVFCGLCVEACPKDAIRMDSGVVGLAGSSRLAFDYTRDLLMDAHTPTDKTKYKSVPLPFSMEEALPNSTGKLAGK